MTDARQHRSTIVPLTPKLDSRGPEPHAWPDARAFDSLRPELLAFASSLCDSRALAEDLVQRAFLRALDADRRTIREPSAWLKRVVRNAFLDHCRRQGTRRRLAPEVATGPCPSSAPRVDARRDLGAALRTLPREWAQAIVLVTVEGWTYAEVAEVQGVAEGTIKSRVSRARQRLAALLRGGRGEETSS